MGFFSNLFGCGPNRKIEDDTKIFNVVSSHLQSLVSAGVISEEDLGTEMIDYNGDTIPKIIATIDKLLPKGYLTEIEPHLERFCHVIGLYSGAKNVIED